MYGHSLAARVVVVTILLCIVLLSTAVSSFGDSAHFCVSAADETIGAEEGKVSASIVDTGSGNPPSEFATEVVNMWNAKLAVLVEKWYIIFSTKCNGLGARQAQVLREKTLVECEKEMKDAAAVYVGSNLSYAVHHFCNDFCSFHGPS
jgi:hypothetical protein